MSAAISILILYIFIIFVFLKIMGFQRSSWGFLENVWCLFCWCSSHIFTFNVSLTFNRCVNIRLCPLLSIKKKSGGRSFSISTITYIFHERSSLWFCVCKGLTHNRSTTTFNLFVNSFLLFSVCKNKNNKIKNQYSCRLTFPQSSTFLETFFLGPIFLR